MVEYDAAIIGGGPAGSFCAILLASEGLSVCLFEQKVFPRDVLCGEFLSYEVSNHLKDAGIFEKFLDLNPNKVTSFGLFTQHGKSLKAELKFTAFGLKRSTFDEFLINEAGKRGAKIYQPCMVSAIQSMNNRFIISAESAENNFQISAGLVIGAYGKKNFLDKHLNRKFFEIDSPYNGVKLHLNINSISDFPQKEIHIYTGDNIYCGINAVNEKMVNICFLEKRKKGDPAAKEKLLNLFQLNPFLKKIVTKQTEDEIRNNKVYGTGGIFFGRKNVFEKGIFMIGDSAGVIAPLAGDGLGIAFESAALLADTLRNNNSGGISINEKGGKYIKRWAEKFGRRIRTAAFVQDIMFRKHLLNSGMKLLNIFPGSINTLIDYTRK